MWLHPQQQSWHSPWHGLLALALRKASQRSTRSTRCSGVHKAEHVLGVAAPAAEPAMETAASLVEQFLPELMAALEEECGENLDMAELMRHIDSLAQELGMQRADQPGE